MALQTLPQLAQDLGLPQEVIDQLEGLTPELFGLVARSIQHLDAFLAP